MTRKRNAEAARSQPLAEDAFDAAGQYEGEAGESQQGDVIRHLWSYSGSPRISRGCEVRGSKPSRITARRSGPMRSSA
jgi:hypothetical protein